MLPDPSAITWTVIRCGDRFMPVIHAGTNTFRFRPMPTYAQARRFVKATCGNIRRNFWPEFAPDSA